MSFDKEEANVQQEMKSFAVGLAGLHNLESLDLWFENSGPKSFSIVDAIMGALKDMRHVSYLRLVNFIEMAGSENLTEFGATELQKFAVAFVNILSLRQLSLRQNALGCVGLEMLLAEFQKASQKARLGLTHLDLTYNAEAVTISQALYEAFQKFGQAQGMEILWDKPVDKR